MSKSLGNTVSPEDMIARYGADTVRLFILFAANPTAGMDWSDAALDANHRVMVQMRGMPAQLMAWSGGASPMDGWLEARFTQRVNEFVKAMDEYDLRRAVEISHYEVIKDINWYRVEADKIFDLARRWLPLWAQMVSVSTPHLAEEWWAALDGTSGLVAGSTLAVPAPLSDDQETVLAGEQYVRDVLEQARKVRVVAERHLGQPASASHVCGRSILETNHGPCCAGLHPARGSSKAIHSRAAGPADCAGGAQGRNHGFLGQENAAPGLQMGRCFESGGRLVPR